MAIENSPVILVVSIGEMRSIALQNNWQKKKLKSLDALMQQFLVADINVESIIDKYAEIDDFIISRSW